MIPCFRTLISVPLCLLLSGATSGASAQSQSSASATSRHHTIDLDWHSKDATTTNDTLRRLSIREQDVVFFRVRHLNFLKFRLELETQSTPVASYQRLDTIWSALLGLLSPLGATTSPQPTAFENRYSAWFREIEQAQSQMRAFSIEPRFQARSFDITSDEGKTAEADIAAFSSRIPAVLGALGRARASALQTASSRDELAAYTALGQIHDDLLGKLVAFQAYSQIVASGWVVAVPHEKTGNMVTVTFHVTDLASNTRVDSFQLKYFIRSDRPLVFHTGYAVSTLGKVSFEKVQGLAGQDLFVQVSGPSASSDLTAFLSLQLKTFGPNDRFGLLATFGVPVSDPSSSVIAGGSFRVFSRLLFSAGVLARRSTEGRDAGIEPIEGTNASRTVFGSLTHSVSVAPSFAVSFRVY